MAVTVKHTSLVVATLGVISFVLGIIAENKKPASGYPVLKDGVVKCKYPNDPTVALGYLSVVFLVVSTVIGYLSQFYPYKGQSVPQGMFFRNTSFLVFFNIALGLAGLGAAMLLWPTITEQRHWSKTHSNINTECLTAKTGLLGGGAFVSLDSSLFWLICLMLANNVREDYFEEVSEGKVELAREVEFIKMGKEEKIGYKAHCLILPYPAQGHINPMLQFSKRLEHKGVKVTLATTHFISKTIHGNQQSIAVETISDGYDKGGVSEAESIEAYLKRFRLVGSQTLLELLEKLRNLGCPVDCVIYDSFMPWALDVAKKFGILGAVFLTQSCAVDSIYYHVHQGLLKLPLSGKEVLLPELPPLAPSEMPYFLVRPQSYPALLDMVVNQFENVDKADWVLCNTFYQLEEKVADFLAKFWPLRTIGPTLPSMYLDKQIQDDTDYGLNIFKPDSGACIKWLNNRPNRSVVYVSFGSLAAPNVKQMEELACGLKDSNSYFLWVVRASEKDKLPRNFVKETSQNGLVVTWCPQLEVLAHRAIGCFVTHCGWNSTLEAISLGVPMVAMPQWTDQTTNAKYVTDVWEVGLRAWADQEGVVTRKVTENCIRELMEGERGEEIRKNAIKWRNVATESVDQGGSSDRNIDEFVSKLIHS